MIQEYEDHLKKLRQLYIDGTLSQRIAIVRQRVMNPNCGPNQLCNTLGALEAIARAILLDLKINEGQTKVEAYKKIKLSNATKLIEGICAAKGISPTDVFGQDWELIQYAEKYRNLLTHEGTFLREGYSSQLIEACNRAINTIEQEWINP